MESEETEDLNIMIVIICSINGGQGSRIVYRDRYAFLLVFKMWKIGYSGKRCRVV